MRCSVRRLSSRRLQPGQEARQLRAAADRERQDAPPPFVPFTLTFRGAAHVTEACSW